MDLQTPRSIELEFSDRGEKFLGVGTHAGKWSTLIVNEVDTIFTEILVKQGQDGTPFSALILLGLDTVNPGHGMIVRHTKEFIITSFTLSDGSVCAQTY
jgi:hypothetical protein